MICTERQTDDYWTTNLIRRAESAAVQQGADAAQPGFEVTTPMRYALRLSGTGRAVCGFVLAASSPEIQASSADSRNRR